MLHAVIMAGGSGTRFWPLSRRAFPKQFLSLDGQRSLIQSAFDRCQLEVTPDRFWVVTNQTMVSLSAEHLPDIPSKQILPEPCARNTAPCVGLAAAAIAAQDPEAVMLVMPADHLISPTEKFLDAVRTAVEVIENDPQRLVLFGVPPTTPATGYGYIERGESLQSGVYEVASFREKPDRPTAEAYLETGSFYWNCGIFVWKAQTILDELAAHQPTIAEHLSQITGEPGSEEWSRSLADQFPRMPSISIDYAVLEKSDRISVVEAPFEWDDVGSWEAVSRMNPVDADGNTLVGAVCEVDSTGCIVRSEGDHVVGILGMKNCIVVHTPDATLVADRGDENAVRKLVEQLQERGYDGFL